MTAAHLQLEARGLRARCVNACFLKAIDQRWLRAAVRVLTVLAFFTSVSCSDVDGPSEPAAPTALFKGTLAVLETGNARVPLAAFANDGSVLLGVPGNGPGGLGGAIYRPANGPELLVTVDQRGFPDRAYIGNAVILFANYTATTVDVAVLAGGSSQVFRAVPLPGNLIQEYSNTTAAAAAAGGGSAGVQAGATGAGYISVVEWLKIVALAASTTTCIMSSNAIVVGALTGPIGAAVGASLFLAGCTATVLQTAAFITRTDQNDLVRSSEAISLLNDSYRFAARKDYVDYALGFTTKAAELKDNLLQQEGRNLDQTLADLIDLRTYPVSVTMSGRGTGTVTRSPDLPAYRAGTAVTLTPVANSRSRFMGWSGACSGSASCTVIVRGPISAEARFFALFALNASATGSGGGTVSAAPSEQLYLEGSTVSVSAVADGFSTFGGWTGACSGTGACSVVMNSDQTVRARFDPRVFSGTFQTSYSTFHTSTNGTCTWPIQWQNGVVEMTFSRRSDGTIQGSARVRGRRIATGSMPTATLNCNGSDSSLDAQADVPAALPGITWALPVFQGAGTEEAAFTGSMSAGVISGTLRFTYIRTNGGGSGSVGVTLR